MNKRIILTGFVLCFSLLVKGQSNLFKDPANFTNDVTALMAASKAEASIKAGNGLITVYSGASDNIKTKLFDLSQKMYQKKKYKATPFFTDFYAAVYAAVSSKNMSSTDLDSMLYVTNLVLDKYDNKQVQRYFTTIKIFFEKDALFASAYNSLYVRGGSYKFRFIDAVETSPMDRYDEAIQEEESNFSDWDSGVEEESWSTITEEEPIDEQPVEENILDVGYMAPSQPVINGAIIVFEGIDLRFETVNGNTELTGTSGSLLLKNNVFVGNGGKYDWTSAGFGPDEIFVEIKEYNFPVISASISAEGVILSYPAKTDDKVEGVFEYKSVKHKNFEDAQYPRFKSYASNVNIKGLSENIEYEGGLSLGGRKIYSSSIDEGYATIRIKKDGQVRIKSRATRFELGDSLITSKIADLVIYQGQDSIIHPGVTIKYNKSISLLRVVKHTSFHHAPFLDSYHKIDISVDGLVWDLNKQEIEFWIFNAKSQIPAIFESEKYYQADKYSSLQGMYRFHPLQMIIAYADKNKDNVFTAADVAKENKQEVNTVKGAMTHLMKLGYIDYNTKTGVIKLRPKARHYVMARRNKADYDNILLHSLVPTGANAILDLNTNELLVKGVERVYLSDSLNVYIIPDSNQVIFLANRDFTFNGKINTQNFQFVGTKFTFNYDSFFVHLENIDAIKVAVTEEKKLKNSSKESEKKSRVLGNELKYSSGTLYINKPENKSSRKKYPEYPIFNAVTGATVFFNKSDINGGAYDTTMQFKIPPFQVDSLSSDDPHAVGFDGEFQSGGIFPPFKEKLIIMPDYSLGFEHHVPRDGYALYGNKGKFYSTVKLNNQGLRGDGDIKYLTTTASSKDFVFYKDSVLTIGTKVDTKPGKHPETISQDVTFPDMQINEYNMLWLPRQDSMFLTNTKELFHLYKGSATLEGTSIISASGMFGVGALFTRGSESQSPHFHFEETKYSGRNAKFQVLTNDPDKPALLCNDVRLEFDLVKRFAYFSPEIEGYASNIFPYLQYKSSLDKGTWDLDNKKIYMRMPEDGHIDKSYFYSTHKMQDSLVFNATEGVYDMEKQSLNIIGIPYIKVADAKILPDSGKVFIHENALMETLKNARIVIDTIHEYHNLYDGTIDIRGRKRFDGEATYQYVNLGEDTLSIKFQDFRLTESLKRKGKASTIALGAVKDDDTLYISTGVFYKGKVTMYADNKILFFDGYVKLDLKGALHNSQWMKYVNNGDQEEVIIDLSDPKADNGTRLFTGLHFNKQDSVKFYTTFISQKKNLADNDIFTANGLLNHDHNTGLFKISTPQKLENKTMAGNVYTYDDSLSVIGYSGTFNFTEPDENFSIKNSGEGYADLKTSEYNFSMLQTFACKGAAAALAPIGKDLYLAVSNMSPDTILLAAEDYEIAKLKEDNFPYKIAEIIGEKGAQEYKTKSSLAYTPLPLVSGEFSKAIVLSEVNYKWSHEFNAWYSIGKIKVSNILKQDINKEMNGYVEIRKTLKGDIINIYLEPAPDSWYFLSYENNRLMIVASDDEVNTAIAKKTKGELPTRDKFFFVKGDLMGKTLFVRAFEENYLGKTFEQTFEQQEEKVIDVVDYEVEKQKWDSIQAEKNPEDRSPYPYEDKRKAVKKEGTVIEEPELNREKKEHTVEEKKQLQKDQQKMKDLFK